MGKRQVGLALGAGGARGLAHIGVLQVLLEHGIRPSCIAGTSMGALIGVLYAAGVDFGMLVKMIASLNWDDLVKLTFTRMGLVSSDKIIDVIRVLTKDCQFADLALPTAVMATDINSGEAVM